MHLPPQRRPLQKVHPLRQVAATTLNTFSRPIHSPIAHLRPARETCELLLVWLRDVLIRAAAGPGPPLALADLGPSGSTWSANSLSYSAGRLYHRTAAELLCFVGGP